MINPRFSAVLSEALRFFTRYGYRSETELQDWLGRVHLALAHEMPTNDFIRRRMNAVLGSIFTRKVTRGGVQQHVPGVQRFTLARIEPSLRLELDSRIFAGTELIRLNRDAAIQKTLQRFSGWVTSMPPQGYAKENLRDAAVQIAKPTRQARYEQRRVEIDQGHKLTAAISHVVATQEGAIAAVWHDRGQYDSHYAARPDHLKRSGQMFLMEDSWAIDAGLVRRGSLKYTSDIEQPAEFPFCSCRYEYVTSLRDMPETVLTKAGREWVAAPAARA